MKILLLLLAAMLFTACDTEPQGLDVKALPTIVKESKDASDIERRINEPDGINNLDLNEDGDVDYVYVTEKTEGGKTSFDFSTYATGEVVTVAHIDLETAENAVNYHVENAHSSYEGSFDAVDFLLLYYIMSASRPVYISPYQQSRPPYYQPYRRVDSSTFASRTASKQAPVRASTAPRSPSVTRPSSKPTSGGTSRPSGGSTSRPSAPSSRPSSSGRK